MVGEKQRLKNLFAWRREEAFKAVRIIRDLDSPAFLTGGRWPIGLKFPEIELLASYSSA